MCRVIPEYRHVNGQQCEGAARQGLSKPRREASEETNLADTLTSDFQPPEVGEIEFLLFKSPSLCYFVAAAIGSESKGQSGEL